jgi:hypothetical protein
MFSEHQHAGASQGFKSLNPGYSGNSKHGSPSVHTKRS